MSEKQDNLLEQTKEIWNIVYWLEAERQYKEKEIDMFKVVGLENAGESD